MPSAWFHVGINGIVHLQRWTVVQSCFIIITMLGLQAGGALDYLPHIGCSFFLSQRSVDFFLCLVSYSFTV